MHKNYHQNHPENNKILSVINLKNIQFKIVDFNLKMRYETQLLTEAVHLLI